MKMTLSQARRYIAAPNVELVKTTHVKGGRVFHILRNRRHHHSIRVTREGMGK